MEPVLPMSRLFSVGYWAFAGVAAVLLFFGAVVVWGLTVPFDPSLSLLHRYTSWWAQLYLRCLPGCHIQVEGRENLAPGAPCVLVANHQSAADILALSALAVPFKWISKKDNFFIPFIGWNMHLNGYVRVEPGNPEGVRRTMERCRNWLERGVPTLWFPEGQRSYSGQLLRFRGGAFRLAAECGCPVVPVVVEGTRSVYRGWKVSACPGRIRIRVLKPVTAAETGGDADRLRDRVWERMNRALLEMRAHPATEEVT